MIVGYGQNLMLTVITIFNLNDSYWILKVLTESYIVNRIYSCNF